MSLKLIRTTLATAVALASSQVFAGGFALNEQSISSMGTAFAGRSSAAIDASTVYGNPAGMSLIKREEVNVGAAVIFAKSKISDVTATHPSSPQVAGASAGQPVQGSNDGNMVPVTGIPMGYYVKPINEQLAFGLGVYAPFGLATDYEKSFQGRYFAQVSHVTVVTIQPTISFRVNDQLSIGFGPTFNHIEGQLTSALNTPAGQGKVDVKGDDTAMGYNAGVLYELSPETRVGLTYHSSVKYKLTGRTKVEAHPLVGLAGKYDAELALTTPDSVDFSITHALDDRWTVYAGSTWTNWSRFKEIRVENSSVNAPLDTIVEEQNWKDTWSYAMGTSYTLNPEWTLRAGVAIDQAPINNTDRSPRIPSGDRTIFSLGAGWNLSQDMTIDMAYIYLFEDSVKVKHTTATKGTYNATYKNTAHSLGASLTYRF